MDQLESLRNVLYEEIPLSRAMGLYVKACDENCLELSAPLSPNLNHKSTAFGGSLYSLAVLTGWGLLYLKLKQMNMFGHIVIQKSRINYLQPVTGDIHARCCFENQQQIDRLVHVYTKRRRARIDLHTMISQDGADAVEFNGRYVIHSY